MTLKKLQQKARKEFEEIYKPTNKKQELNHQEFLKWLDQQIEKAIRVFWEEIKVEFDDRKSFPSKSLDWCDGWDDALGHFNPGLNKFFKE